MAAHAEVTFCDLCHRHLALMGCPGFAGFFSKDASSWRPRNKSPWIFVIGLATAFLTAYYMTRLVVVAFLGKAAQPMRPSTATMARRS